MTEDQKRYRTQVTVKCEQCGSEFQRSKAHYDFHNVKHGNKVFCSKKCNADNRRSNLTDAEKKEAKRLYDIEYRKRDPEGKKIRQAAYYRRTCDREKEAAARKIRMPLHVEYCRQPEYKAKKQVWDQQLRDSKFGEFAEAHRILVEINKEICSRTTKYERACQRGYYERQNERRRDRRNGTVNN